MGVLSLTSGLFSALPPLSQHPSPFGLSGFSLTSICPVNILRLMQQKAEGDFQCLMLLTQPSQSWDHECSLTTLDLGSFLGNGISAKLGRILSFTILTCRSQHFISVLPRLLP